MLSKEILTQIEKDLCNLNLGEFNIIQAHPYTLIDAPLSVKNSRDLLKIWPSKKSLLVTTTPKEDAKIPICLITDISSDEHKSTFKTVFATNGAELQSILKSIEILKSSDHRVLGKQLKLFMFSQEAPGIPFFLPRGFKLFKAVEDYIRESNGIYQCEEIKTPLMAKKALWERSKHTDKYYANMFFIKDKEEEHVLRPMNCPTGAQVFKNLCVSYRDLPVRLSEFGIVHRNEASGALHGLFRARSFMQDDAHIFCQSHHTKGEIDLLLQQCISVYTGLGFNLEQIELKLATRPDDFVGTVEEWTEAETYLANSLKSSSLDWSVAEKDGAFYGPKIELHVKDNFNRTWQCGTIQLDFSMARNLEVTYTGSDGKQHHPIIIHRAIMGSFERFIGILLEHHNGWLPVNIAPEQVVICSISESNVQCVLDICKQLSSAGIRVIHQVQEASIGKKIRDAVHLKIPFVGIVGSREQDLGKISVRYRGEPDTLLTCEELINKIKEI